MILVLNCLASSVASKGRRDEKHYLANLSFLKPQFHRLHFQMCFFSGIVKDCVSAAIVLAAVISFIFNKLKILVVFLFLKIFVSGQQFLIVSTRCLYWKGLQDEGG